ncbi:hypothetical protein VCRA2133E348_620020 [Vibrio crassostreae]|nr:hypothetical protein VCRA2133E348_620020 [Vibrio crassostreae]CAK3590329.1 hypothetical protein VCRA213O314_650021 [Vibrio crassostreae]
MMLVQGSVDGRNILSVCSLEISSVICLYNNSQQITILKSFHISSE